MSAQRANPTSPYQESPPPSPKDAARREPEMVGPFVLGKTLGRGMTGKVRLGTHFQTGKRVAVKILQKKMLREQNIRRRVKREVAILKLLDHPNVTRLYDVRETRRHLFLVMELVEGGELFDYIVKKGKLPREEALRFIAQVVQGLEYCQHFGVCHRDLKPENIMLDADMNVKIGDFGMAQLVKDGSRCVTSCGSPHYASPEVISGEQYDGQVSDVWSIGVILFALVTAMLPFDSGNIAELLERVQRGVYRMPKGVPADVADLIRRMIVVDVPQRLRMADIKYHPCFRSAGKAVELPESMPPAPPMAGSKAAAKAAAAKAAAAGGGEGGGERASPVSLARAMGCTTEGRPPADNLFFTADAYRHEREGAKFERLARSRPLGSRADLSGDILFDLQGLGMGTEEELTRRLTSPEFNQEKVLYFMLRRRRHERSQQPDMRSPTELLAAARAPAASVASGMAAVAAAAAASDLVSSPTSSPPRPRAASTRSASPAGSAGSPPGAASSRSSRAGAAGAAAPGTSGEASGEAAPSFEKISSAMSIITGGQDDDRVKNTAASPRSRSPLPVSPRRAGPARSPRASGAPPHVASRRPKLAISVGAARPGADIKLGGGGGGEAQQQAVHPRMRTVSAARGEGRRRASNPKFHRVAAVQEAEDTAQSPITPSKKRSWFSSLFRRNSGSANSTPSS